MQLGRLWNHEAANGLSHWGDRDSRIAACGVTVPDNGTDWLPLETECADCYHWRILANETAQELIGTIPPSDPAWVDFAAAAAHATFRAVAGERIA